MSGAFTDFYEIISGLLRQILVPERNAVKSDDGVHRGSDFVAHIREERGLCGVRLLGGFQCVGKDFVLLVLVAQNVRDVGFEQKIKLCVLVNGVVCKPLVVDIAVDTADYVYGVGFVIFEVLFNLVNRQRGFQFVDIVSLGVGGFKHIVADIVGVNAVAALGENTALSDFFGVAYNNAVVVVDDIGNHIVLLNKHLFVEHLRRLFVVILVFDGK